MEQPATIEAAIERFERSLRQLEESMAGLHEREARARAASEQVETLQVERERLIDELDQVRNRADELFDLNRQAARRVDQAMERLKAVIGE